MLCPLKDTSQDETDSDKLLNNDTNLSCLSI